MSNIIRKMLLIILEGCNLLIFNSIFLYPSSGKSKSVGMMGDPA